MHQDQNRQFDLNRVEAFKVLLSTVLITAYALPFLIPYSITEDYKPDFIDIFYAIGSTLGIGGYLIIDSFNLRRYHELYLFSAGVFFVGLSLIYIFDSMTNFVFKTYWYVVFNILTTLLCYLSLILRQLSIRR